MMAINATIERVARESYGRLLAFLTAGSGDWSAAEDALSEAFRSALESWSQSGIPEKPEAWLLVVARRRLSDSLRKNQRYADLDLTRLYAPGTFENATADDIPDERLQMLFLCAHPAIDRSLHTPLMLQAVLGLTAERIASAFLIRPSTMGQRLSRAKAKFKQAKMSFELPDRSLMPRRLNAVMEAVYAAYGAGWEDLQGSDPRLHGLAEEAIFLGRLLADRLPDEAEAHGLIALMLYCESRRGARRSASGSYVPLAEQSATLWSKDLILEAERHLARAVSLGSVGRFQLEAAIQSAHAYRIATGFTDWLAIVELYQALLRFAPTAGVRIGHAAAVGEARGAQDGIALLEAIPAEQVINYQPYWALMAHLQAQTGRMEAASWAYDRAIGLCEDTAVRQFLLERARNL